MDFFVFISEQFVLVSILLVLIYLFIWTEQKRGGKKLGVNDVSRLLNKDEAVLLDIRDAADYKTGHIINSLNIPYNKINDRWEELLPYKEKLIILVDKMGQHTGSVGTVLRGKEFQVARLTGGMTEWQSQNLPLIK